MVRISKQAERRNTSPRKTRKPSPKTGAKKDNLPGGFKAHANALSNQGKNAASGTTTLTFIPKIK